MAFTDELRPHYSSSAGDLSSPPSGETSDTGPPSLRPKPQLHKPRSNMPMDEIVVGDDGATTLASNKRTGLVDGKQTQLTASGALRKKAGRKPGPATRTKNSDDTDAAPKAVRKPRKPKDPEAPPVQRKRKAAPTADAEVGADSKSLAAAPTPVSEPSHPTTPYQTHQPLSFQREPRSYAQKAPKRDSFPGSMQSILNADPEPEPEPRLEPKPEPILEPIPQPPPRTSGQRYDPIRGNYDPVRETMVSVSVSHHHHHHPYSNTTTTSGSPQAPPPIVNRASASPSITSLIDPPLSINLSPGTTHSVFKYPPLAPAAQELAPTPPSPSKPSRPVPASQLVSRPAAPGPWDSKEVKEKREPNKEKKEAKEKKEPKESKEKTEQPKESNESKEAKNSSLLLAPVAPAPPAAGHKAGADQRTKELVSSSIAGGGGGGATKKTSAKSKAATATSSPKNNLDDTANTGTESRSILDFGRAKPGDEVQAPTIILDIPLKIGETNRYVNVTRMAEDLFGWDALHPRLAADRDRKARIAAASAALEKAGSGRESGDEMSIDVSDAEGSNIDVGASGVDVPAKPVRKKRNFKEDEYDIGDDFVDDSELLWEAQAAASKDGFFVYSGPLVPEPEKPAEGQEANTKRGRGGRGGRGGRAAARTSANTTTTTTTTTNGRANGTGPRGGAARKPRMTKTEKAQREKEKVEREVMGRKNSFSLLQPMTPSLPAVAGA